MSNDHNAPPFNPLPPVVLALAIVIGGVELVLQLADRGLIGGAQGVGLRIDLLNRFAFSPPMFDRMVETGDVSAPALLRLVSYAFVHLGFAHVLFVLVFLLALGKMVGEVFHPAALLAIFFGSAIVGALAYGLILDDPAALVGGYPAVYGLIGAYTFLLRIGLTRTGGDPNRAFTLIGFLLGIQLLFGALFGGSNDWVAEVAGFVTGFALSHVVCPGGWRRLRDRMRNR